MVSFNDAFAAARKAGKKTFMWNGELKNTKLASDKPATPTPPKRPADVGERKWADPGAREGGRPRDDEPAPSKMDKTGWRDPGEIENKTREAGYAFRKGGAVKKPAAKKPAFAARASGKRDYSKK